jgi:hypothetical protein
MRFYSILRLEILISAGFSTYCLIRDTILVLKACTFPKRREAQPSEDSRADLITSLYAGSTPQPAFPFLIPGVSSSHGQSRRE